MNFFAPTLVCVLALAIIPGCRRGETPAKPQQGARTPAAAPVLVAPVTAKAMPVELRTFGTGEALSTVTIRPQIGGVLTEVKFREGQDVREGDPMFVIDPRPAEAAVMQAEAALARDTAQLRNAEKEATRRDDLFKKGFTSEESRDQARTGVETLRATVAADEAAVATARLNLQYCSIRAPVSGRTGSLLADRGNVVKANETALVTVQQVKPIRVRFAVPQRYLDPIRERMAGDQPPEAIVSATGGGSETGTVVFVDNAVDTTTGTIILKARLDNESGRFWPGQFVDVVLRLSVQQDARVVPASAVLDGQNGAYVYVVTPAGTVSNRNVRVDRMVGDEAIIAEGVAAGESVVTDGQLRLAPGMRVTIKTEGPAVGAGASRHP